MKFKPGDRVKILYSPYTDGLKVGDVRTIRICHPCHPCHPGCNYYYFTADSTQGYFGTELELVYPAKPAKPRRAYWRVPKAAKLGAK